MWRSSVETCSLHADSRPLALSLHALSPTTTSTTTATDMTDVTVKDNYAVRNEIALTQSSVGLIVLNVCRRGREFLFLFHTFFFSHFLLHPATNIMLSNPHHAYIWLERALCFAFQCGRKTKAGRFRYGDPLYLDEEVRQHAITAPPFRCGEAFPASRKLSEQKEARALLSSRYGNRESNLNSSFLETIAFASRLDSCLFRSSVKFLFY